MSKILGKENLWFTNLKDKRNRDRLKDLGKVMKDSVCDLGLKGALILDPDAKQTLVPADASYGYLVFGGILGDDPPRKRTKEELTSKISSQTRNLGDFQMTTDTAVNVAYHIINGNRLGDLEFVDDLVIDINDHEEVEMPFRYLVENGKPTLPDGMVEYLKKKKGF